MTQHDVSTAAMVGRGVFAGIIGAGVMTIFQKLVEMPLTGRSDSYAPAEAAEKVLHLNPSSAQGRKRLNYATHFLPLGGMWGAAYGAAAAAGLRGWKAVNTVFLVVYTGDVALSTALGVYEPRKWSATDWAVDIVNKYVQAAATGAAFDHVLAPTRRG